MVRFRPARSLRRRLAAACNAFALLLPIATLGHAVAAQTPPGAPFPERLDRIAAPPIERGPAATRRALGREALAAGNTAAAVDHLLAALEFHPASPDLLRDLLRACADDPDALAAWAYRYRLAAADARGRARLARDVQQLLPKTPAAQLTVARAAAVSELARWAGRLRAGTGRAALGNGLSARWAAEFAFALARDCPALLAEHGPALRAACERFEPDYRTVLKALDGLVQRPRTLPSADATSSGAARGDASAVAAAGAAALGAQHAISIRAARCLAGLGAQARFDGRPGPAPPAGLPEIERAARAAVERLRAAVERRIAREWTVAELLELSADQQDLFTRSHADWSSPGIAISANRLYQIQTVCGYETLLAAAESVEHHHARLAAWFGKDPFTERRGVVVIVPEHAGLEQEGAVHWWAVGFQRGDRTTIRFAWSDAPTMGRTLTHELTHRFDGALHPFLPAWLVEGKAVWTGRSYTKMRDRAFVDGALDPGAVAASFVRGYGDPRELRKLIAGTIDEYRDNYAAGYALYGYLATWPPNAEPLYRERLDRFMRNARAGRKDPFGFFESTFCDGADGRPEGFDGFAEQFRAFLLGCYRWSWGERDADNAFAAQLPRVPDGEEHRLVHDELTWSWARRRAEPWFGQEHAFAAGALLEEVGEPAAAAAAFLWSLSADGWRPVSAVSLARALEALGCNEAAWIAAHEGAGRFPGRVADPQGPAPMLRALPKLNAWLRAVRAAATESTAAGLPTTARLLRAEHDAAAESLGLPPLGPLPGGDSPAPADRKTLYPLRENPHHLGLFGWREDRLFGYEERRVDGLWFEADTLDLHVGRAAPREDTGLEERRALQRHAFVRSVEWLRPGEYSVRARVHFTTSFVAGAIVIGHTRRDRGVRLDFSAGDYLYAIGRSEENHETDSVRFRLHGLWEREGHLWMQDAGSHDFDRPSSWFDVELHVRGPGVTVAIMGEPRLRYTTPDGSPIEGAVGFAVQQGAVRIQHPTVQRLDRSNLEPGAATRRAAVAAVGFDALADRAQELEELVSWPVRNVPLAEHGTLLVWVPDDEDAPWLVGRLLRRVAKLVKDPVRYPQRWILAISGQLPQVDLDEMQATARGIRGSDIEVLRHADGVVAQDDIHDVWVLFVDGAGVLRTALQASDAALLTRIERWARLYRGRRKE